MKYKNRMPATDEELSRSLIKNGWIKIREPESIGLAILYSLPIAVLILIIECVYLKILFPQFHKIFTDMKIEFNFNLIDLILGIIVVIIFLIIHEIIHAIFIPQFITSNKTVWGLKWYGAFVTTQEVIKRSRFIIISIMPFLIISIIIPILLYSIGIYNGLIIFISIINAIGSSVDLLNMVLIITQVPIGANIIINGFETYYFK